MCSRVGYIAGVGGRAELAWVGARMAAREAHRGGEPGLRGEDVLGAQGVAVAPQPKRDCVAVTAHVAHQRREGERVKLPGAGVHDRHVTSGPHTLGKVVEGLKRQLGGALTIQRRAVKARSASLPLFRLTSC